MIHPFIRHHCNSHLLFFFLNLSSGLLHRKADWWPVSIHWHLILVRSRVVYRAGTSITSHVEWVFVQYARQVIQCVCQFFFFFHFFICIVLYSQSCLALMWYMYFHNPWQPSHLLETHIQQQQWWWWFQGHMDGIHRLLGSTTASSPQEPQFAQVAPLSFVKSGPTWTPSSWLLVQQALPKGFYLYFFCISYHKASSIALSRLQHQTFHYLKNYWMNLWDQNWLFLRIMRTVFPNILWLPWELLFRSENLLFGIVSPNNAMLQSLKKSFWQKKTA